MAEIKTIIKYLEEEKEYKFINNYQTFLNTCYKAFDMSEEEKKSLKIFLIDEDGDEISIDSESDFTENLNSNENNELIYLLKSCKKKKDKKNNEKDEKKNDNKNSENKNCNDNNNNNNNNENNYSKIPDLLKESRENIKKEILEEFTKTMDVVNKNNEKFNEDNLKKIMNRIKEIKVYLTDQFENEVKINKKQEEKKKEKVEKEKEIKSLKKGIKDVKSFLMNFHEKFQSFLDNYETSNINRNKEYSNLEKNFENLKSNIEIIENKIQESNDQIKKFDSHINNLNNKIFQMLGLIQNQNSENNKKEEKEKILSCNFIEGNYILNSDYDNLIEKKTIKIEVNLLNNGNLNWPLNCFLIGKSDNNLLECKIPVNNQQQLLPNQKIKVNIIISLNKIKNEDNEINLPIKLITKDNIIMQQNGFNFKLIIHKSKIQNNYNFKKDDMPPLNDYEANHKKYKNNEPPKTVYETDKNDNDKRNEYKNHPNNYYGKGYFRNTLNNIKNNNDNNDLENIDDDNQNNFESNYNFNNHKNKDNYNSKGSFKKKKNDDNSNQKIFESNYSNQKKNLEEERSSEFEINFNEKKNNKNKDNYNSKGNLKKKKNDDNSNQKIFDSNYSNQNNNLEKERSSEFEKNFNEKINNKKEDRKGNKKLNLLSDDLFSKIKLKLEEDYSISNNGLNDKELRSKLESYINEEIKNLIEINIEAAIDKLCELCGNDLLDY